MALYLGADLNNMSLITEENDEQAGSGNNANGFDGSFCIPDNAVKSLDGDWYVIRVRIYAHDDDTAYDPAIDWSFNGGLTWDVVEEQWFVAATSASDNTHPVGTGMSGTDPISSCLVETDNIVIDDNDKYWSMTDCSTTPTQLYEPNLSAFGGECFGDANAAIGSHLSLIPYSYNLNTSPSFTCNICFTCPSIGSIACSTPEPIVGQAFSIVASNLEDMAIADNKEANFGITFVLHPGDVPPADPYDLTDATVLGTVPFGDLTNSNTSAELDDVVLPTDFPQGPYFFSAILSPVPTMDMTCRPFAQGDSAKVVIPTMGQWALFILGLLLSTLALVAIRQHRLSIIKE